MFIMINVFGLKSEGLSLIASKELILDVHRPRWRELDQSSVLWPCKWTLEFLTATKFYIIHENKNERWLKIVMAILEKEQMRATMPLSKAFGYNIW